MKKLILSLFIVFLLIMFLRLFVYSQANVCIKSEGVWYENTCLTEKTSQKQLMQLGLIQEEKTDKTDIKVTYPYQVTEYPEIFEYLRNKSKEIKKDNGFDAQNIDLGLSGHPWSLNVDMNTFAETGDLASIIGYIFSFTGGAHPNHSYFSVNFIKDSEKRIGLNDLFENQKEALSSISDFTITDILKQKSERLNEKVTEDEWLDEGAGPDINNYSIFEFVPGESDKAEAIKFIFPPYQVGPYVEGVYEVQVPSAVFGEYLNDNFKGSFIN